MKSGRLVFAASIAIACRSASPATQSSPATSATAAAQGPMVRTRIVQGESFFPVSGDSAIGAFVPEVPPTDSAGECRLVRPWGGSGVTIASAYFPSFDSARTTVSVTFDSAGHLVRYSDRRGMVRYRMPPSLTEAQRDSVARVVDAAVRSTTISFDYSVNQAVASNRGGGRPNHAVIGPVRSMENLEKFGPPIKRLERVRRLCGV